jgi:serine protease Do
MNRERLNWFLGSLGERKLLSATLVLFTLALGILIGTLISTNVNAAKETPAAPDAKPLEIPEPVALSNEFTKIAQKIRPSVVNIQVEALPKRTEGGRAPRDKDGMEDFFRKFFGLPDGPGGDRLFPESDRRRPGEGSGVIVDEHGYIITNRHVVEGVDRVRVLLVEDEKLYDAQLIGSDEETDIAVIKIDAGRKLSPAPFGNAVAVEVGDWALAVGSPFGYRESVTVGIISAKSREVQSGGDPRPFQKFLQTDAAINPGNSGGPLVNIRGEVIGINTAIVTRSGGYEGLGFALASNIAADVYNKIIKYGKVPRGSIGISFRPSPLALLRKYGAPDGGVFVERVRPNDGPAARAGIKPEDVIVEIDGKPIHDGNQLIDLVASIPISTKVPIVVVRNGNRQTLQVEIADRAELFKDELGMGAEPEASSDESAEVLFGISVKNLTDADREQLGYEGEDGVLVTEVEPASFADDIGLQVRDIIVAINREPVSSLRDIRQIQDTLKPGDDVVFKVMSRTAIRGGDADWSPRYPAGQLRAPILHKAPVDPGP